MHAPQSRALRPRVLSQGILLSRGPHCCIAFVISGITFSCCRGHTGNQKPCCRSVSACCWPRPLCYAVLCQRSEARCAILADSLHTEPAEPYSGSWFMSLDRSWPWCLRNIAGAGVPESDEWELLVRSRQTHTFSHNTFRHLSYLGRKL